MLQGVFIDASCGKCACADCGWPELLPIGLETMIEKKPASVRKEACHHRMYLTNWSRWWCMAGWRASG